MNALKRLIQDYGMSAVRGVFYIASITYLVFQMPEYHTNYIHKKAGSGVVLVEGRGSGGTGFHVTAPSGKTFLLTNSHICMLADEDDYLTVSLTGDDIPTKVKVIKRMKNHDLCLAEGIPGVKGIEVAGNSEVGQTVAVIGHPGLRPKTLTKGSIVGGTHVNLTMGIDMPDDRCIGKNIKLSEVRNPLTLFLLKMRNAKSICRATLTATMTTALIAGGSSGSPVVNFWGELVGVIFAKGQDATDSLYVPLIEVKTFLKDM